MMKAQDNGKFWAEKIVSLLHDPPHKQFIMWVLQKSHEKVAQDLLGKVIHQKPTDITIKSDRLASALSRVILNPSEEGFAKNEYENEINQKLQRRLLYIDAFKEEKKELNGQTNAQLIHNKVQEFYHFIGKINCKPKVQLAECLKIKFYLLWRFIPQEFKEWINLHPADLRAPNHSIYDHLVQTSALTVPLFFNKSPAFLLFTIGPVQSFIKCARKTQDLWAGSYILSYLTWKAIRYIVENYGPDNIIYPNLLNQPLMDLFLLSIFDKNIEKNEDIRRRILYPLMESKLSERITIANLPNRFVAIIYEDRSIGEKCEEKVKQELNNFAKKLIEKVKERKLNLKQNEENKIKEHITNYFSVYWVILPWCENMRLEDKDRVIEEYRNLVGDTELCKLLTEIQEFTFYKPVYVGSAYSLLMDLLERFLGARKMIRNFENKGKENSRYKCSLCGERDAINSLERDKIKREQREREWWDKLAPKIKEGERLCGVCLLKRFFDEILKENLKEEFNEEIEGEKYPSTCEVAGVFYKDRLEEGDKDRLDNAIEKFFEKVKEFQNDWKSPSVPLVPKISDNRIKIDCEALVLDFWRDRNLIKEWGVKEKVIVQEEVQKAKEKVIEILRDIIKKYGEVSRYFGILAMDGDEMGKWLKGEKMPRIKNLLHPDVEIILKKYIEERDKQRIDTILCAKHPMSPSFHQAFSRKLGYFALEKVRDIVENKHYGKLVYCGGDDVVALLPVKTVLKCAYDLQRSFKEVLSHKASMSAGIVIAHCKFPLKIIMEEVYEAEKIAKNTFGRDAFCLKVLTHSGERKDTGGKWKIMDFIEEIICKYEEGKISGRFPYEFAEVVDKIGVKVPRKDINELIQKELIRIYKRKTEEYEEKFVNMLLRIFNEYIEEIGENAYVYFANLLLALRFIVKEG